MTTLRFQAEVIFGNGRVSKTVLPEGGDENQQEVMDDLRSSIAAIVRRRVAVPAGNSVKKGKAIVNVTYRETPKQQSTSLKIVGVSGNGA
jgi:hypothetical protein